MDEPGVCVVNFCKPANANLVFRTKKQLQNGETMISGDQWPMFLYSGCEFDPEDPWKGLFKSSILISVS
jgi:hypothetical protein